MPQLAENRTGTAFDFDSHGETAARRYERVRPKYEALGSQLQAIFLRALRAERVPFVSIDTRAKGVDSFRSKATRPAEGDPAQPKYGQPLRDITDLAGVRIITLFPSSISDVEAILRREVAVLDSEDKGSKLIAEDRFGYRSIHYLVKFSDTRATLP